MRYLEIINEIANSPQRTHTCATAIRLDRMLYQQRPTRKPNGFWWACDTGWAQKHNDPKWVKKHNRKPMFIYNVTIDQSVCHLVQLHDWPSILAFTIKYGTTPAPNGEFFWQTGDRSRYDPDQDEGLKMRHQCRVTMIKWDAVALDYDGIELPDYQKPTDRPYVDWLDIDWEVPSGCAWRLNGISITDS